MLINTVQNMTTSMASTTTSKVNVIPFVKQKDIKKFKCLRKF